jgi:hypothetical protein
LGFISKSWFNLDVVWALSLILVGAIGVTSARGRRRFVDDLLIRARSKCGSDHRGPAQGGDASEVNVGRDGGIA